MNLSPSIFIVNPEYSFSTGIKTVFFNTTMLLPLIKDTKARI